MQLSPQVGIGLKRLTNQNLISDDTFKQILQTSSIILKNPESSLDKNLNHLCGSKGDIVKESFASLLTLFVESARHDLDSITFSSFLESYSTNSSRISNIVKVYNHFKDSFQQSLKHIGTFFPQIINVHWRLDKLL
uniref:COMM domain-containing protein 3 n=1 Tax=Clastoptera arizonana TaxID=38151 RepID=A0A1B6CAM7_9HEMI